MGNYAVKHIKNQTLSGGEEKCKTWKVKKFIAQRGEIKRR
jgi:hypothetical protein